MSLMLACFAVNAAFAENVLASEVKDTAKPVAAVQKANAGEKPEKAAPAAAEEPKIEPSETNSAEIEASVEPEAATALETDVQEAETPSDETIETPASSDNLANEAEDVQELQDAAGDDASETETAAEAAKDTKDSDEDIPLCVKTYKEEKKEAEASSSKAQSPAQTTGSKQEADSEGSNAEEPADEPAGQAEDQQPEEEPQEPAQNPSQPAETMLSPATSIAAPAYTINEGTYYLTGVNPVFGEYFVIDSSSSYLSVAKKTSSLSSPQQWIITRKTDNELGYVYQIQSASGYYLYASNSGIASISKTASNDDGYFWLPVVSYYNGEEVVAFYNKLKLSNVYNALALVTSKSASGSSVTITVESIACGEKSYPNVPDSDWLWYFTPVTPVAWNIYYSDESGASGATAPTTAIDGVNAVVASCGFTRPGYTFTGWNSKSNGLGTTYSAGSTITYTNYDSDYSIELFAQWKEDTATVTYSAANGGKVGLGTSGSVNSNSVSETVGAATGVLTGTTSATFSGASAKASTGYHFDGWSTSGVNELDSDDATSTTITPTTVVKLTNYADAGSAVAIYHGVTVTANFNANRYTVSYDANGGTGTLTASSVTYGNNDTLAAASALSQDGYTFSGWNTKADGSGVSVSDGATLNTATLNSLISSSALADKDGSSTTLYAQWTENPTTTPSEPSSPEPSTPTTPTSTNTKTQDSTETPTTPTGNDDVVVPSTSEETQTPVTASEPEQTSSNTNTASPGYTSTESTVTTPAEPAVSTTTEKDAEILNVAAAAATTLVTVGETLAGAAGAADSSSFVDAISNLTPAEAAQAATTTVTAVAAVSTVAGLVGAGASIAGAVAGAGAIGAGAAGAVGAASAADLTAELAAESALAGGFFVRLRRRLAKLFGKAEQETEEAEDK